ncbi:MAG: oligopeptidase [Labilithrix sp.]|nr:oligopeptidase [Labilithrix sp.]
MSTANPLLAVTLPVPFDAVLAEHIEPAMDALLVRAQARIDAIGSAPRSYAATLGVLDVATDELDYAANLASHLESVLGTPELRDAFAAITPKITSFFSKLLLSEPLYRALRDLDATDEAKTLDPARRRYLTKTLADFRRNGAELDAAGKKRLSEVDVALSELTLKFAQNVVDATASYELLVPESDVARLEGLPEAMLEAAKKSAEGKGKSGYRFTLQAPSYGPAMTYVKDRTLREALYRAFNTRATPGGPGGAAHDNTAIIREVLALRHEKARLLGFADFADLVTDDRMAKTGARALAFVTSLRQQLQPAFERENEELRAFAKSHGQDEPLEPWDISFWAEAQRRVKFDFDEETLRPYYPLDRVTSGLFEVATSLYGVTIERDPKAKVWHEDVTGWAVTDGDGKRLGGFFLDLFPRETKRDGAWMGGVIDRLPGTGNERENIAVVCANMTPPRSPGQPALLNHREVETLFHEFGHMMHHVLSDVSIRSFAGTRVATDFVELPSMIMENWCWESEALDRFARHFETGAPIPADVKQRMLAARTYRAANALVRQLGFSTVDLMLHTQYDPAGDGDVLAYARGIMERASPTALPPYYAMLASFSHLFGSAYGYAAGYYSYQWSEMLEADAFSKFREGGILSGDVGDRFRREILAKGDTEDPAVLYRAFLGRDPDVAALLTRLGVKS